MSTAVLGPRRKTKAAARTGTPTLRIGDAPELFISGESFEIEGTLFTVLRAVVDSSFLAINGKSCNGQWLKPLHPPAADPEAHRSARSRTMPRPPAPTKWTYTIPGFATISIHDTKGGLEIARIA